MPIADAANINSTGVQISSTNLNTLKLSDDRKTMSIGPGPRWGDVFEFLDGTNLTVVGGRLAPVGVPGLLLGGGISYFSNAHGLSSAGGKVKAYEVNSPPIPPKCHMLTDIRSASSQMAPSPPSLQTAHTPISTGPSKAAATPSLS